MTTTKKTASDSKAGAQAPPPEQIYAAELEFLAKWDDGARPPSWKLTPRGLKRVRSLFDHWISWPQRASLPGGCPVDQATREYQHQPGAMRDATLERQKLLDRELSKAVQMAIESGELAKGTDPRQFAFDMMGVILVFYRAELLLGTAEASQRARTAFDRLVADNSPQ